MTLATSPAENETVVLADESKPVFRESEQAMGRNASETATVPIKPKVTTSGRVFETDAEPMPLLTVISDWSSPLTRAVWPGEEAIWKSGCAFQERDAADQITSTVMYPL